MSFLLIITAFSIFIGMIAENIRWRELLLIGGFIATIVLWQTFNILFRYIGVE